MSSHKPLCTCPLCPSLAKVNPSHCPGQEESGAAQHPSPEGSRPHLTYISSSNIFCCRSSLGKNWLILSLNPMYGFLSNQSLFTNKSIPKLKPRGSKMASHCSSPSMEVLKPSCPNRHTLAQTEHPKPRRLRSPATSPDVSLQATVSSMLTFSWAQVSTQIIDWEDSSCRTLFIPEDIEALFIWPFHFSLTYKELKKRIHWIPYTFLQIPLYQQPICP